MDKNNEQSKEVDSNDVQRLINRLRNDKSPSGREQLETLLANPGSRDLTFTGLVDEAKKKILEDLYKEYESKPVGSQDKRNAFNSYVEAWRKITPSADVSSMANYLPDSSRE